MKRLVVIALLALCVAAYVYRGTVLPVVSPFLPAPVLALLPAAAPSDGKPADAAADTQGKKRDGGGANGGKRGGGGPAAVKVVAARAGSLPVLRATIGTVVPAASTALASQTPGFVLDIHVKDGAMVKQGDLLFSLDDRAIQALIAKDRATLAKDQALLDDANRKNANVQKLVASGVYNQQQGDDAQAAVRVAEAAITVDRAVLAADDVTLSNTRIKAPFDGRIGTIQVSRGAFVASGAPLATITEMAPVFAEFTLSETDLDLARTTLAAGSLSADVVPTMAAQGTKPVSGPVVFIDSGVDAASGTFKLRAQLANDDGTLWPGQSIRVMVHAGDKPDLVIVPAVALVPVAGGSAVNVVKADNTVEVRKVEIGLKVGDQVGIASGLADGDQVVIEGQATLSNGSMVKIADANDDAGAGAAAPDAGAAPDTAQGKHKHKKDSAGAAP